MTFLLLPFYIIIAFFIIRAVLKRQQTRKRKWQMGLLTAFLLYLPLGWDVILGRTVFYTLCATQGGGHVYETVELGPEYWNEDGSPKFILENGELNVQLLNNRYESKRFSDRDYIGFLNIAKYERNIVTFNKGEVIGKLRRYRYFGGWFINYTGFHVGADRCPTEQNLYIRFIKQIFVRKEKGEK